MFKILETRLASDPDLQSALAAADHAEAAVSVIGERLRAIGVQCSETDVARLMTRLQMRFQSVMTMEEMEEAAAGGGGGLMLGMQSNGTVFKARAAEYNPHRNDGTIEGPGGAIRGYKA